jgi:hypothetical protein
MAEKSARQCHKGEIVKVSELKDEQLDFWVAKAGKLDVVLRTYSGVKQVFLAPLPYQEFPDERYSPSTDWSQGGPIIEREKIDSIYHQDAKLWQCSMFGRGHIQAFGNSKLIAAMRCYVASKFGENVPDEA